MSRAAFAAVPGALCGCRRNIGIVRRTPLPTRPRIRTSARVRATWVKQSATIDVEAGTVEAYDTYSNIEEMPQWSPWLREVRVDPRDGMLSEWVLFARGIEISWKARITDATRGKRIAWKSESGLVNRGYVSFDESDEREASREKSSVTLAIEFDVPGPLAKVFDNNFIGRFVRETLLSDLKRFRAAVLRKKRQRRLERQTRSAA